MQYLDHHTTDVLLYENSDYLAADGQGAQPSNLDIFQAELGGRGMEGQCFLLNSKLFGLPQNRRRFFAIYVASRTTIVDHSSRSIADMFATLRGLLQLCQTTSPALVEMFVCQRVAKRLPKSCWTVLGGHSKLMNAHGSLSITSSTRPSGSLGVCHHPAKPQELRLGLVHSLLVSSRL